MRDWVFVKPRLQGIIINIFGVGVREALDKCQEFEGTWLQPCRSYMLRRAQRIQDMLGDKVREWLGLHCRDYLITKSSKAFGIG